MPRGGKRKFTHEVAETAPRSRGTTREAADSTTGGGGGGRGGRARGTALRKGTMTTAESTGEVERVRPSARKSKTSGRGKGMKTDAPRSKGVTSGRGSTGARKSVNRPGASGSPKKKKKKTTR